MGDYSGSLVLEVATHVATTVTAQLVAEEGAAAPAAVVMTSEPFGTERVPLAPLAAAVAGGAHGELSLPGVAAFLRERGAPFWTFYVYGSVAVFVRETGWTPPGGASLRLEISSSVPTAQGVSSSASIEVAVIRALRALSGVELTELRTAHIAQAAENYVVGAPCGLMDQLASACGEAGKVLPILCRPDVLSPPVPLPPGVTLVGWPSGVKHSIGAGVSPYLTARTATFMAKKLAEAVLGAKLAHAAELDPYRWATLVAPALPEAITGRAFTDAHGGVDDGLSRVDDATVYPVRAALHFVVTEHFHCGVATSLLELASAPGVSAAARARCLGQVGELMRYTHAGYTALGLGCPETDAMVERLRALGPAAGIYGARVSGGGSGGTVAVLCEVAAVPTVAALAAEMVFDAPFTGLIQ